MAPTPESPTWTKDEYARWSVESALVKGLADRVARVERAILVGLKLPTTLPAVYAVLAGERPGPAGLSARDRTRAIHAMHVLALLDEARRHLALGQENARLAAHAALLAGLYAGDSALRAVEQLQRARKGGATSGRMIAKAARQHDAQITTLVRRWRLSDELQDQYPSATAFVRARLHLDDRTIQRALQRIKTRTRQ